MGQRGPSKEPLAFKIAKGTDRAADHRSAAVNAPSGIPEKPDWLANVGDIASATWDELVEKLSKIPGMLTPADGSALAMYCVWSQRFREAGEEIARDGITCVGEKGGQYQHPAVGIQSKATEVMNRIGAKFGLTPSDRAGMKLTPQTPQGVRRRERA